MGTYVRDGKCYCLNCKEKEVPGVFSEQFDHCGFFCSEECRDIWNRNHPDEDFFNPRVKKVYSEKKYCPNCNYEMKQFFDITKGSYWKCKRKTCVGKTNMEED